MIEAFFQHPLHTADGRGELMLRFTVEKGEFLAVTGPSGSGKTTMLRMLAGLLYPQKGRLLQAGDVLLDTDSGIRTKPQDRSVGMVFQDYALFPNMTVRENLLFALSRKDSREIISELTETFEIGALLNRFPRQLSGGQQQRVALARALVRRPTLLLLDEPLSALDPDMRTRLQDYVLEVHRRYALTTILVSHDYAEICKMANRVIRLENGSITEQGPPACLQRKKCGMLSARYQGIAPDGLAVFLLDGKVFKVPVPDVEGKNWKQGDEVEIFFRS